MDKFPSHSFAVTRADLDDMIHEAGESFATVDRLDHPLFEKFKSLSMHSRPPEKQVRAVIPDFEHPDTLIALGCTNENGKWYVPEPNRSKYFKAPLTQDSVVIVYDLERGDIGFCGKDEFKSFYAYSDKYKAGTIEYVDPERAPKGEILEITKSATAEFWVLPQGTHVETSEGPVIIHPGEVLIKNEKNKVYKQTIAAILERYKEDPFSPASRDAFRMLEKFAKNDSQDATQEYSNLVKHTLEIDRNQVVINQLQGATGESVDLKTLRDQFTASNELIASLNAEMTPRLDAATFKERLVNARTLMREIIDTAKFDEHEKSVRLATIMAHLLPKTNNHQHLKGSVPKETLLKLAQGHGLDDTAQQKLLSAYEAGAKGFPDLDAFNQAYGVIAYPVRTPEDYRIAIHSILERANRSGQLTVEIRCSVIGQRDAEGKELDPEVATENILAAIKEAQGAIGEEAPQVGFTFLGYRGRDWKPEEVTEHARLATVFAERYPSTRFSFDIAGPEDTGYSPKYFKSAYDLLRTHNDAVRRGEKSVQNIGITTHAGETPRYDATNGSPGKPGYESIKEAIEMGVMRIGHGVQAVSDPETLDLLKKHDITVEICGCCNVNTIPINTEGMAIHPLQEFLRRGIKVTICTDNDTICNTGITGEYGLFLLSGHGEFMNWNTIKKVVVDGIQSSFITEDEKRRALDVYAYRIREIERLYRELNGAEVRIESDASGSGTLELAA